jgi:pimeloyl-ACP methyl ester carboxylesterase
MSVILAKSLDKIIPLSKITTNATIVYGENDTIIDFYDVEAMSFLMPNCSIKIVPGTGHFLHLENDKVFSVYEQIFNLEPSLIR